MEMKPLPAKSLDVFCSVFDFSKGQADITCPADTYPTACLRACERRGLLVWDTERVRGKTKRWCALTTLGAKVGCESMALVPDGTVSQRKRLWVKVQFDVNNPEYADAYRIAGELAEQRLLAETVADLLRIHDAAENGDYRLFYELYGIPETQETRQFENMLQTFGSMQSSLDALVNENRMLREQLQNTPQSRPIAQNNELRGVQGETQASGVKQLAVAQIAAPTFDDEDEDDLLEVKIDVDAPKRVAENFLRSLGALNS